MDSEEIDVNVDFGAALGERQDAYERLLGDALQGSLRRFARQDVVEGTWLSAELLVWGGPSMQSTRTYQTCVRVQDRCRPEHAQRQHAADDARQGAASAGSAACCQGVLAAGSACCRSRLACSAAEVKPPSSTTL